MEVAVKMVTSEVTDIASCLLKQKSSVSSQLNLYEELHQLEEGTKDHPHLRAKDIFEKIFEHKKSY